MKTKTTQAICKHCKGDLAIRNPKGFCDHLGYPAYCNTCLGVKTEAWEEKEGKVDMSRLDKQVEEQGLRDKIERILLEDHGGCRWFEAFHFTDCKVNIVTCLVRTIHSEKLALLDEVEKEVFTDKDLSGINPYSNFSDFQALDIRTENKLKASQRQKLAAIREEIK